MKQTEFTESTLWYGDGYSRIQGSFASLTAIQMFPPIFRPVFWILLILCVVLSSPGCKPLSSSPTVIDFWAMGQEGEQVKALVPEFERRYPYLRVRVQQIPWSAAHEKLLTAYAGNALPDAFQLGTTWIPEFVALRAIVPLDERLAHWPSAATHDYFPGIWATNQLAGRTWALPWYVDTRLFFYRRDLLYAVGYTEPPTTWAEWQRVMIRIKTLDNTERYAILLPINEWQLPVILALQAGAPLLCDHNQYGCFQHPRFREAFQFYLSLFAEKLAPPVGHTQIANLYQEFAKGYFAIHISGPWNIGEFQRRLPTALQEQWMTAPLPTWAFSQPNPSSSPFFHGGKTPFKAPSIGVSLAGGASLALSRTSRQQDAAWRWLEYLAEPAQQARFYTLTGDLPARQSAWQMPPLTGNRYAQAFRRQLDHVHPLPPIPEWERIANRIAHYAEMAVRQRMTVDEALAALDREVDRILEKRRWLLARGMFP